MSQAGSLVEGGSGPSSLEFDTNSGTAVPLGGVLNILGSGGVSTSGSGNTVTINVSGTGFTWNVVTSSSNPVTLVPNNGYITKGSSQVQFTLPASATIGDTYRIVGYANLWTIAQNAMQNITLGAQMTTTGVTGSMSATVVTDCIELVCVTTNTQWFVVDSVGNLSMV